MKEKSILLNGNSWVSVINEKEFFRSMRHKYNWTRKFFAENRNAPLFYQPKRLFAVCQHYDINQIIKAVKNTVAQRRGNYFVTFLEQLGETRSYGDWDIYDCKKKKEEVRQS